MNLPSPTRPLAATSWLWPTTLPENLRRITAWDLPVRQVALLFYQHAPSLAYRPEDFAAFAGTAGGAAGGTAGSSTDGADAADLPAASGFTFHVHLPADLPWQAGPGPVWDIISRLMALPAALNPWGGVLHPPADPALFEGLARLWRKADPGWRLMVENLPGLDLHDHWPVIEDLDLPVCLDVGHLMAFGQERLLTEPGLAGRVELVHCYAPGVVPDHHEHLSLGELTPGQAGMLRRILTLAAPDTPLLFEVFSESDLRESLETFYALTREWEMQA